MGSYFSSIVDNQTKKTQDFMVANQQTMFERQLQMQNYMREQAFAMQIARSRDLFHWWAAFFTTVGVLGTARFVKTKNPNGLVPMVPLSFIGAYYFDLAYGSKLHRMREEAKKVLSEEEDLVGLPTGLPNIEMLDERRKQS